MKINKATFEALPEEMKKAFKAIVPEGKTEADATEFDNGEEDASTLKSALDHERERVKTIAQERDALKGKETAEAEKARKAAEKAALDSGDTKALEKSYKEREKAIQKAADEKLSQREAEIARLALDSEIEKLSGIFTVPSGMKSYVKDRLRTEFDADGKTIIRVLDGNGQPSASTLEDFKKEMLANPDFKGIIAASKGSGGGATNPGGSGSGGGATQSKIDVNKASASELKAHLEAKGIGADLE